MLSFKSFLKEETGDSMDVSTLKFKLEALGFKIKKITGKQINVIAKGDRVDDMKLIAKELKGAFDATPKSDSGAGRVTIAGGFKVIAKPAGGGSGAGSDITQIAECAQCLWAAAKWAGQDYSLSSFKDSSVKRYYDIDMDVGKLMAKIPDNWLSSSAIGADILHKNYKNKRYTFHRGSKWVDALESHWKKLNKDEKVFANLNKWSPADIYMVSEVGNKIQLTKSKSIVELNTMMMEALKSKDIIGVSLKQMVGSAKLVEKNVDDSRPTYAFKSVTIGKRSFMQSQDSYLEFDGGLIQFRTFGSTWQGEIKGKNANMGKISGGPINVVFKKNGLNLKPQSEIAKATPELIKEFYKFYQHFESGLSYDQFQEEVLQKGEGWYLSKFLSAQLAYVMSNASRKVQDRITSQMIGYAASESEMSGPYIKVY